MINAGTSATKPVEQRRAGMRGLRVAHDPGHERARIEPVPPAPGPGEILVRQRTCAVSRVYLAPAGGVAPQPFSVGLAQVGTMGATGTVIATGAGVTRFAVGDEVFGRLQPPVPTRARYVLTDADGPHVELRPAALAPADAAALVESGLTATTIVRAAEVQPGHTALVIGATRGVGRVLVSLLAAAGASVIAIAAPGHDGNLRSLGPAVTIDDGPVDAIQALTRHPDVDLLVDLLGFREPYFVTADAIPSSGWLVGALPAAPAVADTRPQQLGIPRIAPRAEPGDLAELARCALEGPLPIELPDVQAFEDCDDWLAVAA